MYDRLRAILFPLLVFSIISSIWAIGRAQEMEDDLARGLPTVRIPSHRHHPDRTPDRPESVHTSIDD